ncbi:hypothetical protein [Bacillus sp. CH_203]|uniref:hypothetical protein n=1 Tax=Bacillus sp. CH_203 TaxID=2978216 RepID=UPI002890971F|nr:hypothetical protein [Bacillus cereus]HDX9663241.1 hypothetical protein [Bacillus cereus]
MYKQVLEAIDKIKSNDMLSVRVSLHIHNEEEFKDEHIIYVSLEKEKNRFGSHSIDLHGLSVQELRKEHQKIFEAVKTAYPDVIKSEHVHKDEDYNDID